MPSNENAGSGASAGAGSGAGAGASAAGEISAHMDPRAPTMSAPILYWAIASPYECRRSGQCYCKGARLPLSPRYNFAVVAAYNFDIVTNFSGVFTVTDHWVGDRLAAFGTPVSPQYELSSYDLFGDPPQS